MQNTPNKTNISSTQVLKTLQIMLQGDYTMQELLAKLNANEKSHLFNNSIVSKYINSCRFCGIDIPKIHNKYFVTSVPFGLELTMNDVGLLEILQNIIKHEMAKKSNKIFNAFAEKINRFSNKKIAKVEKETYHISAELFEHAITEKRKIRLMFKNKTMLDCIPLNIAENKGKTFFHVMYNNKERMIDIVRVSGIEVLSEKYLLAFNEPVVVFKLKGALALRYHLRENERLIQPYNGECIVVSNQCESKEILFARLLRYYDKCEILNPKGYREEMSEIINSTLSNYGISEGDE